MDWAKVIGYGVSFLSGGLAGAVLNHIIVNYKNRVQKMHCYYLVDDVQSKIPVVIDNTQYDNMHLKKYQLMNTTNRDIEQFSVRFVFDQGAVINDFSSHTKKGESKSNIVVLGSKNECTLKVKDFNRKDKVDVTLRVGNMSSNSYFITEFDSIGFKIKCKDKRKKQAKTLSKFSDSLA